MSEKISTREAAGLLHMSTASFVGLWNRAVRRAEAGLPSPLAQVPHGYAKARLWFDKQAFLGWMRSEGIQEPREGYAGLADLRQAHPEWGLTPARLRTLERGGRVRKIKVSPGRYHYCLEDVERAWRGYTPRRKAAP